MQFIISMNSGLTRDIRLFSFIKYCTSLASQKILCVGCRVTPAAAEQLNQRHKQQLNNSLMTLLGDMRNPVMRNWTVDAGRRVRSHAERKCNVIMAWRVWICESLKLMECHMIYIYIYIWVCMCTVVQSSLAQPRWNTMNHHCGQKCHIQACIAWTAAVCVCSFPAQSVYAVFEARDCCIRGQKKHDCPAGAWASGALTGVSGKAYWV